MTDYVVTLDGGRGGDTTIQAESMVAALEAAGDWACEGEWGLPLTAEWGEWYATTSVRMDVESDTEECSISIEVVGEDDLEGIAPDCDDDHSEHEWTSPHDCLGGCDENPGVWGLGGAALSIERHCAHCGAHREEYVDHCARGEEDAYRVRWTRPHDDPTVGGDAS